MYCIRDLASNYLNEIKSAFIRSGTTAPFLLGVSENGSYKSYDLEMHNKEINRVPLYLKDMAVIYDSIILIADMFINESPNKTVIDDIENLENHPGTTSALICIIYSSIQAYSRTLRYIPGNFNFFDSGWGIMKKDESRIFLNPYEPINTFDSWNGIDPFDNEDCIESL